MTATAEEAAFQAALDAQIEDDTARLVFADWLDDRDDPRATGYRLLAAFRLRPSLLYGDHPPGAKGNWGWSSSVTGRPCKAVLKSYWWNALTHVEYHPGFGPPGYRARNAWYPTRAVAEDDAAAAVSRLTEFNRRALIREAGL